ncbi:MAG: pseudaminic acid biosynthesis-associated methylase [Gammaproteobacteria bacterium]|nr:pseudaminic acid biosynthesis-associated methylase [Gammaproteobacteria bacterium]
MEYKTEQESFWAGEFGDAYSQRNNNDDLLKNKMALFSKILGRTGKLDSVIEFGSNIGLNLRSLANLDASMALSAVEINAFAKAELEKWGGCTEIFHQSALDFSVGKHYELSMILGVLIHINPDELPKMYEKLYESSSRWVLIAESYNPTPVMVKYRGNDGKYFKRDFAGEMMAKYPELTLADYGFVYHGDPEFPLDDITWFLLKKP